MQTAAFPASGNLSFYLLRASQWFLIGMALMIPVSTTLMQVFLIAAAVLALASGQWRNQYNAIITNPMAWLFAAFIGLFLAGLTYTTAPLDTALSAILKYHRFILGLFLFYLLADEKIRRYAIYAFLFSVIVTLILSYVKAVTHINIINKDFPPTDSAVIKNHIDTAFLFAIGAYFFALLWIKTQTKWRWFWAALFLLTVFNMFFINQGRSGYFVLIALMALLGWQFLSWRGLLTAVVVSALFVGAAAMFSTTFKMRMDEIKQNTAQFEQGHIVTSMGLRIEFIKNSLKVIKAHPLLGTGTGTTMPLSAQAKEDKELAIKNPHNQYLNMMIQFGVFGLIMLLALFICQWRYSYCLPEDMKYITQAVVVIIAVGCLANSWLMDVMEGYFYVFFTALTFAAWRDKRKSIY